jgi:hypothetical protein
VVPRKAPGGVVVSVRVRGDGFRWRRIKQKQHEPLSKPRSYQRVRKDKIVGTVPLFVNVKALVNLLLGIASAAPPRGGQDRNPPISQPL